MNVQLMQPFNPMNFDPTQGGGSWPLGRHPVVIESAEVKPTQDNTSGYLQLNCKIIDGPNAGFTGAYRLNLYNQSAKAAEIAHKQLSAICHVVQVFQLGADGTDLRPLFNRPFVVDVVPQKGDEAKEKGYTEISRVYDMNGNEPGKAAQQAAPAGFGGQQQQQAAPAQQQPAQGFGGQPQTQQQPAAGAQAWGAGQAAPQGNGMPAGGGAAAPAQGWGQNAGGAAPGPDGGAKPAWGQR